MAIETGSLSDIQLIQKLGSCDTGSVYLATLKCTKNRRMLAAKFINKKEAEGRNREGRSKTEREILEMLDHPFLPKLHGIMENERWLCLLTEFCEGGDLHVLRQRQIGKRFSENAVRFYASEIIIAIEYLHMLGIVYRDLKPENVLVQSDGHIMLTDFDLSLKSEVHSSPDIHLITNQNLLAVRNSLHYSSFLRSFCMSPKSKRRKKHALEFVAEPFDLRSMSFVGTHEYLAPEFVTRFMYPFSLRRIYGHQTFSCISAPSRSLLMVFPVPGNGHGSAVDWWTLGIFMYELLYGYTPFRGSENEHTLANIVARAVEFPNDPPISTCTKELISGLLNKDPAKRIGSLTGASAIKRHSCFDGVNWALLRSISPPYIPPPFDVCSSADVSDDDSDLDSRVEYF